MTGAKKSLDMNFLGVDIGGTSVRSLVTDADGTILGYQRAARISRPTLSQALNDCLTALLTESAVGRVEAAVVGAAGAGPAGNRHVRDSVEEAFRTAGLRVAPRVATDIEIAYWSAATSGDGSILAAGTGAIAGRFSEWHWVDRRDGAGWLLGDHGSGYWIGRKALRAAAADLDGRGPHTTSTSEVVNALGLPAGCSLQDLIAETKELRPSDVAGFAPIVLSASDDETASFIVACAASELRATVKTLSANRVILAGGLFAPRIDHNGVRPNPLRSIVEQSLGGCMYASHPVVGACWEAGRSKGLDLPKHEITSQLEMQ